MPPLSPARINMEIKNKIIDGQQIAEKVKDEIALEIFERQDTRRPSLAIILVGERPDSQLYVSLKEKEAKKVGIDTHLYHFDEMVEEQQLMEAIDFLNKDPEVDAILIQLPLPSSLNTDKIVAELDSYKDADGFHPQHPEYVLSPVVAAVDYIVDDLKLSGRACIFHRSDIFGETLKKHLETKGLTVDLLAVGEDENPMTDEILRGRLSETSRQADIVVTALGLPLFLDKEYIKEGATVIDVGINKDHGHVHGDVDFESVIEKAAAVTPVPGGIGPMTIAFLFKNVIAIYNHRQ